MGRRLSVNEKYKLQTNLIHARVPTRQTLNTFLWANSGLSAHGHHHVPTLKLSLLLHATHKPRKILAVSYVETLGVLGVPTRETVLDERVTTDVFGIVGHGVTATREGVAAGQDYSYRGLARRTLIKLAALVAFLGAPVLAPVNTRALARLFAFDERVVTLVAAL